MYDSRIYISRMIIEGKLIKITDESEIICRSIRAAKL